MTVYTVWSGKYSERMMHGAFSTEEKAQEYVRNYNTHHNEEWDDPAYEGG